MKYLELNPITPQERRKLYDTIVIYLGWEVRRLWQVEGSDTRLRWLVSRSDGRDIEVRPRQIPAIVDSLLEELQLDFPIVIRDK